MVGRGNSNYTIMTQSSDSDNSKSDENNTQNGKISRRYRLHQFFHTLFNRKPAYMITRTGIEVKWFDFSNPQTLPFDTDTYNDTQIFIGDWANPWYVDVDAIEDQYDDFTKAEITTVNDVFKKKHIYPSQRWKTLANQNVLSEMFIGRTMRQERVVRLLYAVCGGLLILAILILFGG